MLTRYLLVASLCTTSTIAAAQCGGTERWAVKDGTDDQASQVNLANPETKSVAELLAIPQAHIPHDNITRVLPDETHLYKVSAHLVKWKQESGATGDSDYHLVLTDETLSYTGENGGTAPTGHSFIGEIPNPDCLSGRNNQFGTTSPFLPPDTGDGTTAALSIATARKQLDAQFPNADLSGGWNDAEGIPVEVIGVGYFDPPHGQTGRSPHNLELHPILAISFGPSNVGGPAAEPSQPIEQPSNTNPPAGAETWQYKMITATTAEELLMTANNLGKQGWELVSVAVDVQRPDKYVGYLKRADK